MTHRIGFFLLDIIGIFRSTTMNDNARACNSVITYIQSTRKFSFDVRSYTGRRHMLDEFAKIRNGEKTWIYKHEFFTITSIFKQSSSTENKGQWLPIILIHT